MLNSPKWLFEENQRRPDRDRLEAYLNSLSEGFLAFDDTGKIEMCNGIALNLLDSHGVAGQNINQAVHLSDSSGQPVDLLSLAKSQRRSFISQDLGFTKPDGSLEHLVISFSPIISPKTRFSGGYVLLIRAQATNR